MLDVSFTPIVDHLNHSSISLSHTFQGISVSPQEFPDIHTKLFTMGRKRRRSRGEGGGRKDGAKISEGTESEPRRLYVRPPTNGIVFYMVLSSRLLCPLSLA